MLIVQLSDLHIVPEGQMLYGLVDTAAALKRAVQRIGQLMCPPDCVLITGDLVNRGRIEEYAYLRTLLAPLPCPYYFTLGNHDHLQALQAVFPEYTQSNEVIENFPLRIILLDSHIVNQEMGQFDEARLAWLDAQLAQHSQPTLIAFHHPPFATGMSFMDEIGLQQPELLAQVVARHTQIVGIVCGHAHRAIYTTFGGKPCLVAPSPAHQIVLDLGKPPVKKSLGYALDPAGFFVHQWEKEAPLVTHYVTTDAGQEYFYD